LVMVTGGSWSQVNNASWKKQKEPKGVKGRKGGGG